MNLGIEDLFIGIIDLLEFNIFVKVKVMFVLVVELNYLYLCNLYVLFFCGIVIVFVLFVI